MSDWNEAAMNPYLEENNLDFMSFTIIHKCVLGETYQTNVSNRAEEHQWFSVPLTRPTTSPQRSSVRGCANSPEDGHPLSDRGVEVVVVWDGGDPEVGVVLRRGVGPIAVSCSLGDTGVTVVCEFGCFLILALHTAHYL